MSVGLGAAVLAALSTVILADIICHHYALLAVECVSTLTLERVRHQYSSTVLRSQMSAVLCPRGYKQKPLVIYE